jgi:DNA-directed RNA polymerase specialized sigma24 family protein
MEGDRTMKDENKENYYVSPKVFKDQIQKYYESDIMTDELAINLVKIAEGLSYKYNFINYTWKDEMVGDALVKMYAALQSKKFRIDSEFSPFGYFNQIAWHAFCNRIKKEKRQHDGLEEYKQRVYEDAMHDPSFQGHIYVKPHLESDENDGDYE